MTIGLVIYFIGAIATIVAHMILGWKNIHSPPPSIVVVLMILLVGFFRTLFNMLKIVLSNDSKDKIRNKGEFALTPK